MVNPKNPISDLTLTQLRDIYLGKIRDWKDIGGNPGRIVVVSRDSSSGTFGVWKDMVMLGDRVVKSRLIVPSNGGIVQAIAKTPGAIGYIGLGYMSDEVKAVSVNGVEATDESSLDGTFPIVRGLFMFTNGWPDGETQDFIDFLLSPEGQGLVKKARSIPLF